jgi:hypothetical protein
MSRTTIEIARPDRPQLSCLGPVGVWILVITAVPLGFLLFLGYLRNNPTEEQIQARVKAAAVYQELEAGMTAQEVQSLMSKHEWWPERIHVYLDTDKSGEILLLTPGEISELNWVIQVGFENNEVTGSKLGISDHLDTPPPDAEQYLPPGLTGDEDGRNERDVCNKSRGAQKAIGEGTIILNER